MKKNYIAPECDIVALKVDSLILAGSIKPNEVSMSFYTGSESEKDDEWSGD